LIDPTSNGQRPSALAGTRPQPRIRDLVSIVLPSQHDRTIQRPGTTDPPHTRCNGTHPDRARPVITLFTMSNSQARQRRTTPLPPPLFLERGPHR
jgi:hypothetical protein